MTRILRTIALAMGLGLAAGPAFAVDPFFPEFGNNGIDVAQYDLALDVDPASGAIQGTARLTVRAERRLTRFTLDLHGLNVSGVFVDGAGVAFVRNGDKLTVYPQRPLAAGTMFTAIVVYGGVPDPLPDPTAPGFDLYLGWFKHRKSTYVVSEPVGASTFFPANDEPTDKASYTFAVTVPEGFTAVANGTLARSKPLIGGKRRFDWVMKEPMTSWLATVHVNRFHLDLGSAADGTPIRVYAPEDVPQSHIDVYAKAGEMLGYFEGLIGPYPFASYGSVLVEDRILYYALETQAMSTFPEDDRMPDEAIVAHELAHQWFGNSVSVAHWEDLWLAEGSATYFEVLWQFRDDPKGFNDLMLAIYDYVAANKVGPAVVEAPDQLFTDRTYYRGAAALYALRLKVGESAFFNILRHFVQDNRGGSVTSEKFIRTAVSYSGDGSVRDLLEAWLYDQDVPPLAGVAPRISGPKPVPRPPIVGGRCGHGSHRGSPASCGATAQN